MYNTRSDDVFEPFVCSELRNGPFMTGVALFFCALAWVSVGRNTGHTSLFTTNQRFGAYKKYRYTL